MAKSEQIGFSDFMKKYLKDEYEAKFCDYLYSIRSGHFHSGEMFFLEYDLNLDITLDYNFIEIRNRLSKSLYLLRKAFVQWIEKNIIKED
ncbi:hypothetical protein [Inconstantimicrobium porci]|uniref:Uncharacterized protein n=1 Tax=Inconstantimicrobium porci TaxID=2652291 RepID=A0A7X2N0J5_9CLOT|nr:hypothetical protein [Inconstantimicrobium porci]MSR92527.1 hypothetical protein [Inconstantimicrobium porci]